MKRIIAASVALVIVVACCSCKNTNANNTNAENNNFPTDAETADLGEKEASFGESIEELNLYEGYFEDDLADVVVECVSGSDDCYNLEGNTITFSNVSEDSVYSITGKFKGNIIIDIGEDHKFDLELTGFSLVSDNINPITVLSGDEVSITAKNETTNYIYDESTYSMTGERTGKTYKLGQPVKIRVERADKITRTIDFSFVN